MDENERELISSLVRKISDFSLAREAIGALRGEGIDYLDQVSMLRPEHITTLMSREAYTALTRAVPPNNSRREISVPKYAGERELVRDIPETEVKLPSPPSAPPQHRMTQLPQTYKLRVYGLQNTKQRIS